MSPDIEEQIEDSLRRIALALEAANHWQQKSIEMQERLVEQNSQIISFWQQQDEAKAKRAIADELFGMMVDNAWQAKRERTDNGSRPTT